jgi:hypothetical protein
MKKTVLVVVLLTSSSIGAFGQHSGSHYYVFAGAVAVPRSAFTRWNANFVHVGGGGEGRLTDRLGLGGEIGVLKPVTNQYAISAGLASVIPAYHFLPKGSNHKFDPFVDGGLSLLFSSGAAIVIHYGGGVNCWWWRRTGLRLEFRHHLWSPEGGETIHFVNFRVGMAFR